MKKKISVVALIAITFIMIFALVGCYATFESFEYTVAEDGVHIMHYEDVTTRTELVVPDEIEGKAVVALHDFAIVNTLYLKKITIGKNIKTIMPYAINNNQGLLEFAVADGNEHFKAVDGVLYSIDGKVLVSRPIMKDVKKYPNEKDAKKMDEYAKEFIIPDGVEIIAANAFYHNKIQKLVMPDSVKEIRESAFLRVFKLTEIQFSKGLEIIRKDAFSKNTDLKEVLLYDKIILMENFAFFDCENLLTVNIVANEADVVVGNKWMPTKLGNKIKELKVTWGYVL